MRNLRGRQTLPAQATTLQELESCSNQQHAANPLQRAQCNANKHAMQTQKRISLQEIDVLFFLFTVCYNKQVPTTHF